MTSDYKTALIISNVHLLFKQFKTMTFNNRLAINLTPEDNGLTKFFIFIYGRGIDY